VVYGPDITSEACLCFEAVSSHSTSGPTVVCTPCTGGAPSQWRFTLAGCTGTLAALNGTWTLNYAPVAGLCGWSLSAPPVLWAIQYLGGTGFRLNANVSAGSGIAIWTLNPGWSCLGPNTLTRTSQSGGTVPLTVTVTGV
jgi:hypothetical protein